MERSVAMPAAFAHYRFGQAVLSRLPPEKQTRIQAHRFLYDLGLQGPDLLFHYRPLGHDPLNGPGSLIHEAPAEAFFRPAGQLLCRSRDSEALTVYIWGFLCHFALDWHCHGYIGATVAAGGPGHLAMETDFDRAHLAEAGLPVSPGSTAGCIKPSRSNARLISVLFPGVSVGQLYMAMATMSLNQRFLSSQSPLVRGLVKTALKLCGRYEKLGPMLLHPQPDPRCEESSRQLMICYTQAQDTALRLIEDFRSSAQGLRDYDPLYQFNFNAIKEVTP